MNQGDGFDGSLTIYNGVLAGVNCSDFDSNYTIVYSIDRFFLYYSLH